MPGWVSPWELVLLLFVVLIIFGPKRLPEMGRSLGKGMREFKESISGKDEAEERDEQLAMSPAPPEEPEPAAAATSSKRAAKP